MDDLEDPPGMAVARRIPTRNGASIIEDRSASAGSRVSSPICSARRQSNISIEMRCRRRQRIGRSITR